MVISHLGLIVGNAIVVLIGLAGAIFAAVIAFRSFRDRQPVYGLAVIAVGLIPLALMIKSAIEILRLL